ncbi:MAG: hypothetical protein AB7D38_10705 [Sulfurimonas sp.]|uniref:hypothetical protein n=1 Tax=Sulfurimonas sp. TaxID=2022749 RepID=UPI003D143DE7
MRFFDFLKRYINNLVRLNNLNFRVDILQNENKAQKEKLSLLHRELDSLKEQLQIQKEDMSFTKNEIEKNIPQLIAKEIFYQSLSLQQRVDQFVFDANIELKTKIIEEND